MSLTVILARLRRLGLASVLAATATTAASAGPEAPADGAPVSLRIVGGLAGLNPYVHHEEPFWTRELTRLTGGRVRAEIVPFDRAGIRGQEMLRLIELGAVPFGTALLPVSAAQDPELAAPDLAAAHGDIEALHRTVEAFRPYLRTLLAQRYRIELLALYVHPAQVTFCKGALSSLADLKGRRIRVSSPTQADWVVGLGATPVTTAFAEILPRMKTGAIDCAITGSMSGNTIGLHEVTTHLQTTPVGWGLAAFVANAGAWAALPADLRALLQRELPQLERRMWDEAARESGTGIACNVGAPACVGGRRGRMVEVPESAADRRRREAVFSQQVLPAWLQRCGTACAAAWRETLITTPLPAAGARAP